MLSCCSLSLFHLPIASPAAHYRTVLIAHGGTFLGGRRGEKREEEEADSRCTGSNTAILIQASFTPSHLLASSSIVPPTSFILPQLPCHSRSSVSISPWKSGLRQLQAGLHIPQEGEVILVCTVSAPDTSKKGSSIYSVGTPASAVPILVPLIIQTTADSSSSNLRGHCGYRREDLHRSISRTRTTGHIGSIKSARLRINTSIHEAPLTLLVQPKPVIASAHAVGHSCQEVDRTLLY